MYLLNPKLELKANRPVPANFPFSKTIGFNF